MLTDFRIQNFRSCADVAVSDLHAVTALVGRNGAGKSNILQAIAQTARISTSADAIGFPQLSLDTPSGRTIVTLGFKVEGSAYRYQLSVGFTLPPAPVRPAVQETLERDIGQGLHRLIFRDGGTVVVNERAQPLQIGEFSPSLPALVTLLPANDFTVTAIRPASSFLSAIRYYALDETASSGRSGGPVLGTQYATWLATYEATGTAGDSVLMRLIHMFQKRQDDFGSLKALLGPNGLGLIDDIEVNEIKAGPTAGSGPASEGVYYFVLFTPSRGVSARPVTITADGLSAGTRRVLRMLVSMIFDRSSVMLMEQPEDSLHQGLTKKIIGVLRQNSGPAQLILSSHSSALLNKLKPSEIRLVTLRNGFTTARPLTEHELQAAAAFMNDEGPLYDFLDSVQED